MFYAVAKVNVKRSTYKAIVVRNINILSGKFSKCIVLLITSQYEFK